MNGEFSNSPEKQSLSPAERGQNFLQNGLDRLGEVSRESVDLMLKLPYERVGGIGIGLVGASWFMDTEMVAMQGFGMAFAFAAVLLELKQKKREEY